MRTGAQPGCASSGVRASRGLCVRLLELENRSTPAERFAFLAGAFLASDLDALKSRGVLMADCPVLITGGGALAGAWSEALQAASIPVVILAEAEVERAFLAGLSHIVKRALTRREASP